MVTARVLEHFAPPDAEAVRVLADEVERATGVAPFGDETWAGLAGHSVLGDRGFAAIDDAGILVAYAHLAHHLPHEWSVEVAALDRGRDHLRAMLRDAIASVRADGGGHLTFWAHAADADDDALARDAGLDHERDLLQMRVRLPLAQPVVWPDGVDVRAFRVGVDERVWLDVNNRAFAGHPEQGGWTIDNIVRREAEPWFDPEGFILAFDADGLAGFCWTKVHAAEPPREPDALGEIYVIGADPRWHGRGLGRALTAAGLESLADRGVGVGILYVDGANAAAVGLYRALGFSVHRTDRAYGTTVAPGTAP